MDFTVFVFPAVLLIVGAAVGFVPTMISERSKRKHELETRWDAPLFELCSALAASARNLLHLSERRSRATDVVAQDLAIDVEHAKIRALSEQLHLVGSKDVQVWARKVVHHAYSVRRIGEGRSDRHPEYGAEPRDRFIEALDRLYVASRHQLGVADPEGVVRDET